MFRELSYLRFFFENPHKDIAVREYATLMKISPATASKRLSQFVKQKYLQKRAERQHLLFSANTGNDEYKDAKKYYALQKIKSSGLLDHLISTFQQPYAIYLFGSYAKAEFTLTSDIDIFVLSAVNKEPELKSFEKKLGTTIQVISCSQEDVRALAKKNPDLLNNIVNGDLLHGFWEVF